MAHCRISPSLLASYFYYDCPRQLRIGMMPSRQQRTMGLPTRDFDSVMRAVMQAGCLWEEEVITGLGDRVQVASGEGPLQDRHFSPEETLERLATVRPGEFIYQATFAAPSSFYARYGLDPDLLEMSANRPDLIECLEHNGGRLFRIIDIKRGESLALTYRVQVMLYALQLETILEHHGIEGTVDIRGGAWLGNMPDYEPFSLTHIRPHVEQFLSQELTPLAIGTPEEAFWHINYRCERCNYFDYCHSEARETNDLSRLSRITAPGKQYLHGLGVRNLEALGHFLEQPSSGQMLSQCASLKGERHYLKNKVAAYQINGPVEHGSASPALPILEDIALTLTIQKEPLGRSHYLAGLYVEPVTQKAKDCWGALLGDLSQELYPDGKALPVILLARQPDAVDDIRRQFIELLTGVLERVDLHNGRLTEWADQLSLQCYVNTTLEKRVLQHWLLEAVGDAQVGEAAMQLLLWFQAPDLLDLDEHPQDHLPYPVVSLQQTLALVLALPVDVIYTLWDSLPALGSSFNYQHRDYYHYRLAQSLQPQAIHAAWQLGQSDKLTGLEREGQRYLYALSALRRAIRAQVSGNTLFSWPEKFKMPRVADIRDPHLSRLAFFARYEQMVEYESVRNMRVEPQVVQLEQGYALLLEAKGGSLFEVVGPAAMGLESNDFGFYLLVRDTEQGRREQLAFNDRRFMEKMWAPKKSNLCRVRVGEVVADDEGLPVRVCLEKVEFEGSGVIPGERFLLLPCHTDFNTGKVIKCLQGLDQKGAGLFGALLANPTAACTPMPLPAPVMSVLNVVEGHLGLSSSQQQALHAICDGRVTAVWGPPGTGKTHFLGVLLLALAHAYEQAGLSLRVLVTGQSHYAIENVLRKVLALKDAMPATPGLSVIKAGEWKMAQPTSGLKADPEKLESKLKEHSLAIVGATVYSTWKAISKNKLKPFDLVVIDEASQVRVAEASIPVSLVGAQGRLILTGDDYQLPPIVKGDYPEPPAGQPALYGSIFELITSSVGALEPVERAEAALTVPYFKMLLENRRMNGVINRLASDLLYGPHYHPATQEIAQQQLRYMPGQNCSELVSLCLDPSFPIVLAIVDSPMATNENRVEAEIVGQLVMALREGLRDEQGLLYEDERFFKEGVFVVCPHRAQNHLVKRLLLAQRDWLPRADTVDKMQGQEAQAVIVSYGVSDPEYAAQEAEFIYSRNRLNVAVTRAQSKCVIVLSTQLLNAPPSIWDNARAAEGLGFMRAVVQYARTHGQVRHLDQGVPIELLRVGNSSLNVP